MAAIRYARYQPSREQKTVTAAPPEGQLIEGLRSLEVRWILPGRLDPEVVGWFGRFPAEMAARQDAYLLDPDLGGLSVKVRAGTALEVKVYQGSPGILDMAGRAKGRIESWQKWSFPLRRLNQDGGSAGWRMIGKRRRVARFSLASGRAVVALPGLAREPECAAELTEIRADGQAWRHRRDDRLPTVANLLAAARLVHDIVTNNKLYASNATGLLATGGVIWATNVIAFGLWYWDLDRGGAASRAHHPQANPAFVLTWAARTPLDVVVRLADRRLQRLDHRVVVGLVEVDQRDQVLIWRLTSACGSTRCRLDFRRPPLQRVSRSPVLIALFFGVMPGHRLDPHRRTIGPRGRLPGEEPMSEGLSPSEVGKEISEHRTRVQETAEGEKEKGNSAADETTGRDRVMTIIEALLLTVVAVLAAWSGFAAAKWGTESSLDLVENREAALWNQMRDRHPGGHPAARCWI